MRSGAPTCLPACLPACAALSLGARRDGIWWISEKYTTGHMLPLLTTVPIEEATFFVVTNAMCVQGVHLFLDALVHLQ